MTTKFGSFDASPTGAFAESRLGARNRPGLIVILIWIDESRSYNSGIGARGRYRADRQQWVDLVTSVQSAQTDPSPFILCTVMHVAALPGPSEFEPIIFPDGETIPQRMTELRVQRDEPSTTYIDHLNWMLSPENYFAPTTRRISWFGTSVAHTSSMNTDIMQPGYGNFIDWFDEHHPSAHRLSRTFTDERWLLEAIDLVQGFLDLR